MTKRLTIPNRVSTECRKFKKGGVTLYVHTDRAVSGENLGGVVRIHLQAKGAKDSDFDWLLSEVTAHINTQLKIIEVTP